MLLQVYLTTGLFVIVSWISFIVPPEVVPGKATFFYCKTTEESLFSRLMFNVQYTDVIYHGNNAGSMNKTTKQIQKSIWQPWSHRYQYGLHYLWTNQHKIQC